MEKIFKSLKSCVELAKLSVVSKENAAKNTFSNNKNNNSFKQKQNHNVNKIRKNAGRGR